MKVQRRAVQTEESKALAYRVTPAEHDYFREMCKKDGVTISTMLERIVSAYINRRKNKGL